ncbi:MAG: hypothetical protein AVDCRST_MAG08-2930, partial [uncultured Acetobacteraceae bacterium]
GLRRGRARRPGEGHRGSAVLHAGGERLGIRGPARHLDGVHRPSRTAHRGTGPPGGAV